MIHRILFGCLPYWSLGLLALRGGRWARARLARRIFHPSSFAALAEGPAVGLANSGGATKHWSAAGRAAPIASWFCSGHSLFLGLNRRSSNIPGQRYRHAKQSNRFQIFPHGIFSRPICFALKPFLPVTQTWIVGIGVKMHSTGRKRARIESGMERSVRCFLLLFLQVPGVFPLYVAVYIWPKLF